MSLDELVRTSRNGHVFRVLDGPPCHTPGGWDFWRGDFPGVFEPFLIEWIDRFCDKYHDYLDIGSWVGPTVLYASRVARNVLGFEPDPVAWHYLKENVSHNCLNTIVHQAAVSTETGQTLLASRGELGNSMSTINVFPVADGVMVNTVSLESVLTNKDYNFSFIKIDIEGGESKVLPQYKDLLTELKIPLSLSFHYDFYRDPETEFQQVLDAVSGYTRFYNQDNVEINLYDFPRGFGTLLCL